MEANGATFTVEYVDIYGEIIVPLVVLSLTIKIDYSSSKGFLHLSTSSLERDTTAPMLSLLPA